MNPISWSEAVRFCGFLKNSHTAQSLYLKAKTGRRLTARQIYWVYKYADIARAKWGSANVELDGRFEFPLLYKNRVRIEMKNGWIVEPVSGKVMGRIRSKPAPPGLILFPNGIIHPANLKKHLLSCHFTERSTTKN
jgi:hypothetical protein